MVINEGVRKGEQRKQNEMSLCCWLRMEDKEEEIGLLVAYYIFVGGLIRS